MSKRKKKVEEVVVDEIVVKEAVVEEQQEDPNLDVVLYKGDNDREIMEFSSCYHIECSPDTLKLYLTSQDGKNDIVAIKPGQFLVREHGKYRVIDHG